MNHHAGSCGHPRLKSTGTEQAHQRGRQGRRGKRRHMAVSPVHLPAWEHAHHPEEVRREGQTRQGRVAVEGQRRPAPDTCQRQHGRWWRTPPPLKLTRMHLP